MKNKKEVGWKLKEKKIKAKVFTSLLGVNAAQKFNNGLTVLKV